MIGATIGITFALSLMCAPVLNRLIGVPGIFTLTGLLSLAAILVVRFVVPTPLSLNTSKVLKEETPSFKSILKNKELSRLNFGIFALDACLMPWGCCFCSSFAVDSELGGVVIPSAVGSGKSTLARAFADIH